MEPHIISKSTYEKCVASAYSARPIYAQTRVISAEQFKQLDLKPGTVLTPEQITQLDIQPSSVLPADEPKVLINKVNRPAHSHNSNKISTPAQISLRTENQGEPLYKKFKGADNVTCVSPVPSPQSPPVEISSSECFPQSDSSLPLKLVSPNILALTASRNTTMSGHQRTTNNSNKSSKAENKNKKPGKAAPEEKENSGSLDVTNDTSVLQNPGDTNKAHPGQPGTNTSIADQVIDQFTTRWETFKEGFRLDLDTLTKTLTDGKTGLVVRVETLETNKAAVENRLVALETDKVQSNDIETRLAALEATNTTKDTSEATILSRIEALERKCSSTDVNGYSARMTQLEQNFTKITKEEEGEIILNVDRLESTVGAMRRDVDTISGYMHVMDRNIKSVDHRATMNSAKLLRNILIFGGVRSTEDQSAKDALELFLNNILRLPPGPDDIIEAKKLGKGYKKWVQKLNQEVSFPPPIRARCTDLYAAKVMQQAYTLDGKKDQEYNFKYYIRYAMPEALKAVRDQHSSEIRDYKIRNKERKEGEPKTEFYFNGDRFFVNGEVVEQDIKPPTCREMLSLDNDTLDKMEKLDFASAGPIEERNSVFEAFAINVQDLDDIDLAYMRIRQYKKFADHIVCAYRLKNEDGIKDGGTHDKEYYGDQEILKIIRSKHAVNLAVFVSREYGGIQLGPKRFEIIRRLATNAIEDLEPQTIEASEEPTFNQRPLPQRTKRKDANNTFHKNGGQGRQGYRGRGYRGGGYNGGFYGGFRGGGRGRGSQSHGHNKGGRRHAWGDEEDENQVD